MSKTKTNLKPIHFWGIAVLSAIFLLYLVRDILPPFIFGILIAYLLDPVADRLEKIFKSRAIASLLIILTFFGLVFAFIFFVTPVLIQQATALIQELPSYGDKFLDWLEPKIENLRSFLGANEVSTKEVLSSQLNNFAGKALVGVNQTSKILLSGLGSALSLLSFLLLSPFVAFYTLKEWDHIIENLKKLLPKKEAKVIAGHVKAADKTISGFLRGQFYVAIAMAVFYSVGLFLLKLDYSLLIGITAGFLNFIPMVGLVIGAIMCVTVAIFQFQSFLMPALVLGLFLIGQIIEGNFITPKLVGKEVGLPPLWIIFALLAGGTLFGFVGVVIAVPVAAIAGTLLRYYVNDYNKINK